MAAIVTASRTVIVPRVKVAPSVAASVATATVSRTAAGRTGSRSAAVRTVRPAALTVTTAPPAALTAGDSGPAPVRPRPRRGPPGPRSQRQDLRSANRPDRERSPQIDDDVTGKELDRATQHQIKTLEDNSAEWVARHLVMAGRLIDDEPELAFQHALAASRRGGRLAAVREAVGLTAYAAGHYGEALREFRTYRRISGSNMHLPVMADCERGLGRPDRALDMARSDEAKDLDAPGKVELAIVAAGARTDLGQLDAAVSELEIAQLDINRAFSYSPRLFRAYADALTAAGRAAEAEKWQRQAVVAENALGVGVRRGTGHHRPRLGRGRGSPRGRRSGARSWPNRPSSRRPPRRQAPGPPAPRQQPAFRTTALPARYRNRRAR